MRKKTICFHGAILAFYAIAVVYTIIFGILGFAKFPEKEKSDIINFKMNFNFFTYTLPFVAFIFDHSSKKILNLTEKSGYVLLKLLLIIYYLGAYVLALQGGNTKVYYLIAHTNFLIYPILTIFYAYLLRKKKLQ